MSDDPFLPIDAPMTPAEIVALPPEAWLPDGSPAPPYGVERNGQFHAFTTQPFPRRCQCGELASIICLGTDAMPARETTDLFISIVPQPAVPAEDDINLCLACATARGWPRCYPSEGGNDEPATDDVRAADGPTGRDR